MLFVTREAAWLRRRLRRVDGDILVTSSDREVWADLETLWISLLAVDPRDKRRRNVCPCDVRERISTTDPWIEVDGAVSLIVSKEIAIENADMAQLLANQLAELFDFSVLYCDRAVGLPGAHFKLSLREGADVAAI